MKLHESKNLGALLQRMSKDLGQLSIELEIVDSMEDALNALVKSVTKSEIGSFGLNRFNTRDIAQDAFGIWLWKGSGGSRIALGYFIAKKITFEATYTWGEKVQQCLQDEIIPLLADLFEKMGYKVDVS